MKDLLKRLQDVNEKTTRDCQNYEADNSTCRINCYKEQVEQGGKCPFIDQSKCACYHKSMSRAEYRRHVEGDDKTGRPAETA